MRLKTTVLVTAAAAIAATAPLIPSGAATPGLAWNRCDGTGLDPRQECATLKVPLDYGDPNGPQIALAISRIRSARPGTRRGALVLIPGGPGNSGLNGPSTTGAKLPQQVRDAYDVIGFDPRGVGKSTPVSCGLAHDDLSMEKLRPWPSPDGDITDNLATERRVAETCARNGGPVLRSISTRNEARDIDGVRRALGEDRISAWGVSYGTYVGAVYSTMFARHTDRVVLDSNDDPDSTRVERAWLANYDVGVEDRFPDFARWASAPGDPVRIAGTPAAVRTEFLDLAARLDRTPIPWPGANPPRLTGNGLREALLQDLYDDEAFPDLARLVIAARDGGALPDPGTPPDDALQNTIAVTIGTICEDVRWPRSAEVYAKDVVADRRTHPLTAGMPVNVMPCAFWPYRPAESPVRVTSRGPSNVLLVQNLRDPATPYSGALKLREALGDRARMVAVDSGGHEAYLANGNACGDRTVTEFLVTGRRPSHDTLCRASG
jgi:pimeloyl-ACP methyl ester carboxylesterase